MTTQIWVNIGLLAYCSDAAKWFEIYAMKAYQSTFNFMFAPNDLLSSGVILCQKIQ